MTDVSPYTLGIAVVNHSAKQTDDLVMAPIIERNAVVPVSRSDTFWTVENKQKAVAIQVYQGENLRPYNNIHLGDLEIPVPAAPAGQEAVEVRFTYDINGALEVEAKSVTTGQQKRRIFKNQSTLTEKELVKSFAALESIKLHPRDQAENKALIARAERIYAESLSEKRDHVLALLRGFETAIQDQRSRNLHEIRRTFGEALDQLEVSIFDPEI